MESRRVAVNSASVWLTDRPSVSAREKLATMPRLPTVQWPGGVVADKTVISPTEMVMVWSGSGVLSSRICVLS